MPYDFEWQLLVVNPVLIAFGLITFGLFIFKERKVKVSPIFYLETFLIWIANAVLVRRATTFLSIGQPSTNLTILIVLVFLGSIGFFSIILKPLATFLTGKIHHRRYWMWAAIGSSLLSLLLSQFVLAPWFGLIPFIFVVILTAFSTAAQSLYYLFLNEQFYYRRAPILSSVKIGTLVGLGTMIGGFIFDLNLFLTKSPTSDPPSSSLVLFAVVLGLIIFSFIMSFFNPENPNYVQSLGQLEIKKLPQFTWKILSGILIVTFLWGLIGGLNQSQITDFLLGAQLRITGKNANEIFQFIKLNHNLYLGASFLIGYWSYYGFGRKLSLFQMSFGSILLLGALAIIVLINQNWILLLMINFCFGIILGQLFFWLFGYAIMWNYRAAGIPVTGLVAAAGLFGQFVVEATVDIFDIEQVGIFSQFHSLSDIVTAPNIQSTMATFVTSGRVVFGMILVVIILLCFAIWYSFKYLAGDNIWIKNERMVISSLRQKTFLLNRKITEQTPFN